MQRTLSFDTTPTLAIPLPFLLAAPWFATAAGVLLLWHGPQALATRWSPVTIALTHLVTLGFLAMSMVGAMLQMLPVVAGLAVPHLRLVARGALAGLACGVALLAGGLLAGSRGLVAAAVPTLGCGFVLFIGACATALVGKAAAGARPMTAGMRLAVPALAVTISLGLTLATWLAGGPAVPAQLLTDLHAGWGLLGWVALLVMAVSFQVIPMFQSTQLYPRWLEFGLPAALVAALAGWSWSAWTGAGAQPWFGALVALVLAGFAGHTLWLLGRRKRAADVTTLFWRLSLGSLLGCVAVWLLAPHDAGWRALLLGVLFLAGFAMAAVNGMLYKIVPFLLWYHLAERNLPRSMVPNVNTWIGVRASRWQFALHAGAVSALCAAAVWPVLARLAALLLIGACALLGALLAQAALRYRRIARASALEGL